MNLFAFGIWNKARLHLNWFVLPWESMHHNMSRPIMIDACSHRTLKITTWVIVANRILDTALNSSWTTTTTRTTSLMLRAEMEVFIKVVRS